jgi:prepilin-type N-terminal cleavage/methylation domain-containing protein
VNAIKTKGFTLIELMIAIAIVAILAAIALPSYLDFTTRAKVSEGFVLLDGMKLKIEETFYIEGQINTQTLPQDVILGSNLSNSMGRYINTQFAYYGTNTPGLPQQSATITEATKIGVRYNDNIAPAKNELPRGKPRGIEERALPIV